MWHAMQTLHSPDGRVKRRQRFALGENGDIVLLLPWLMVYTKRRNTRLKGVAQQYSEEAKPLYAVGGSSAGRGERRSTDHFGRAALGRQRGCGGSQW